MTRRLALAAALVAALLVPALADDGDPFAAIPDASRRADLRAELAEVLGDPTVMASAGPVDVKSRPEAYRLLLDRLRLSARALEVLQLESTGRYAVTPVEDPNGAGTFRIDDGAGARATCAVAFATQDTRLILARGTVDLPVVPTIRGAGAILVRYAPAPGDPARLRCRVDVRFKVQSRLLHLATAPLRSALSRVLTDKLRLLVTSAAALAERVEADPWKVHAELEEAGGCDPADLAALRAALFLR